MEPKVVITDETELARQLERFKTGKAAVDRDGHREEMKAKAEDYLCGKQGPVKEHKTALPGYKT